MPVAGRLLRGAPRRRPARGLLAPYLDARSGAPASSLVRVRRHRRRDGRRCCCRRRSRRSSTAARSSTPRPAVGGQPARPAVFALLAETGMRLGEALGMRISDFVMGRGGTPLRRVVPRDDNPTAPG